MSVLEKREKKIVRREKEQDKDMEDLVEYVTWITQDLGVLRDRVRIAEKIISDLKRSGEENVEALLKNLYEQSKLSPIITYLLTEAKQEELDEEASNLRDIINTKEYEISKKEEEINRNKRVIEMETSEKELEIKRIRQELDQQKVVMEN